MKRIIILGIIFLFSANSFARNKRVRIKRTKIEYKKRQKIDLGALMIDGEVITPGDFSVTDEKQKAKDLIYKRKNYYDRLGINIQYVF